VAVEPQIFPPRWTGLVLADRRGTAVVRKPWTWLVEGVAGVRSVWQRGWFRAEEEALTGLVAGGTPSCLEATVQAGRPPVTLTDRPPGRLARPQRRAAQSAASTAVQRPVRSCQRTAPRQKHQDLSMHPEWLNISVASQNTD